MKFLGKQQSFGVSVLSFKVELEIYLKAVTCNTFRN